MINGFAPDRCAKRNRLAAKKYGVNSIPVTFLKGAPSASASAVWSRGTLPQSDTEALERINARLPNSATPLTEDRVYIHYLEAANGNYVGDRSLFLSASTLKNIASNAEEGFAFMNSHRTGGLSHPTELPFGRTFAGRYEQTKNADGTTTRRSVVGFYMLRDAKPNGDSGPSTDALHEGIDAGTIFDVSVGLRGGKHLCDICGNDINEFDYDNYEYACPHLPGTTIGMSEEQQAAQHDKGVPGGVASYTLFDAYCGEVSAVYDGAVPGAGFKKALALARHGAIARQDLKRIPAYSALLGKGDFGMDMDEIEEKVEGVVKRALSQFSRKHGTNLSPSADEDERPTHPVLVACLAAGITTADQFKTLQDKAGQHDALKVKADAFDAGILKQRDDAKKLLVVLYPDKDERAAEESVIDNLPAGPALDRYCTKVEREYDAKLGTNAHSNATRLTQPPAASPSTISEELTTEEVTEAEQEVKDRFAAKHGNNGKVG